MTTTDDRLKDSAAESAGSLIADWATVEQEARPRWEERNPGTWEEFKDIIRYAWAKVRSGGKADRPHADASNAFELTAEKYDN